MKTFVIIFSDKLDLQSFITFFITFHIKTMYRFHKLFKQPSQKMDCRKKENQAPSYKKMSLSILNCEK